MTKLKGSGTVPVVMATVAQLVILGFWSAWFSIDIAALPWLVLFVLPMLLLGRALFVGVFLDGDDVVVRGWLRDHRYGPGDLTKVTVVPYWKFLDARDPILSLLKFTPREGWVREVSATVSWRDRTETQAAEIRRHLGIEPA